MPHEDPLPPAPFAFVATLGPASRAPGALDRLVRAADRLRLNGSHLDPASLTAWLEGLEAAFARTGRRRPLVLDLQGAKMRVGAYPAVATVPLQLELRLASTSTDPAVVPVPHPELFAALEVGEALALNDARVRGRVTARGPDWARLAVDRPGPLAARKGINRPDHPIPWVELGANDAALIATAAGFPELEYAFSFVHTGAELGALRARTARPLVAKLERPEAFDHLPAIAAAANAVWLCRGDLGAQAGLAALGPLQARLTRAVPTLGCPAYLAGQVLEHMTVAPTPTRSEVVHLHDVAAAGWAGAVLSDETAIGAHVEAVADLLDLLRGPLAAARDRTG